MKFNVPSKALYSSSSAVSKVINSKNALTILNNFLFTLSGDTLTITASDMENTLTARLNVTEAQGEGRFCIDARRMVDLLREIPDQGISFEINGDTLAVEITCQGGRYSLIAQNGMEYPSSTDKTEVDQMLSFSIDADKVIKGIDNTLFAVSTDELRPQMMGILWDIKPDGITFVATDTHKLVRYASTAIEPGIEGSFILPVKPANIIKNVLGKDDSIDITFTPKGATFSTETYTFNCRFIKGNFPDYNRVIPKNNPSTLTIDRQLLLNAVRRVGVFVESANGLIKFKVTAEKVIMKAQDNNTCTLATEELSADYQGNDLVIGFSAPYLLEICNTITTSDIIVKLADPSRPGVFVPSDTNEDGDLLILLMPMNVTEF